ncbi:MAG TPA: toxin-antitoxin system HicB family antitoxin [Thermoanaerobaculia bacterium]|jgi:uncharacterized protein (DUF1778 family)
MGRLALRLPDSLHQQLATQAQHEGISLNQYLVYLLAQRAAGFTVRVVPPEEVGQQREDYARLLEELGPPAAPDQVRAALAAREPGEPEPGLTPELVGWLEERLR